MYIDTSHTTLNGKTYCRRLLRDSYREDGKVKHRTIANLSNCSEDEIVAIRLALKHKGNLSALGSVDDLIIKQGMQIGAVYCLRTIAERIGIIKAFGDDVNGGIALWQIIARLIDHGSRLSAVRLAQRHDACNLLSIDAFDENDLYSNLKWISDNQDYIEQKLFSIRYGSTPPNLFLYDVTSSYLEGKCNAFGFFGYNRDGKKGKEQIVIGLLTGPDGAPVSVRVFDGNTQDTKTVPEQIRALAQRFGVKQVTMVGDRGMLKCPQIDLLNDVQFHYITAITKSQIDGLLKSSVFQMNLFDQPIAEVENEGVRYVLRRNPQRAKEIAEARWDRIVILQEYINNRNKHLKEHPKAKLDIVFRDVSKKMNRFRIQAFTAISANDRYVKLDIDKDAMERNASLDGCYTIKTDLPSHIATAQMVHDRYKDLAMVEKAFRTFKNGHLEIQPTFVRTASSTRAHVFVIMLAYMIERELANAWRDFDVTVAEGIDVLGSISSVEVTIGDACCQKIPKPTELGESLLRALNIKLPEVLPRKKVAVATKKNLPGRRKKK